MSAEGEKVLKKVLKGLREGSPEYIKASREHHAKMKRLYEQKKRRDQRRRSSDDVIETGMFD